ncbi:MAG: NAD(P)/FAD-dependent oxidoreductase [Actinobacteria bacterium]|nr:NAD(P)/FAD-dependent oxidoreductase [Actinomycetota bacterium]
MTPISPPEELRAALGEAHLPTLVMAMATLSGDGSWLREDWRPAAPRGAEEDNTGGLPPDVQADIRAAAFELIMAWRAGKPAAEPPPGERILEMLEISLGPGNTLPPGLAPVLAEELGAASRDVHIADPPAADEFRVIIIGGGFAGLCAAIKLQTAGIAFTIIEKNDSVGGTWLENSYPGCGVDTPSHLYSFSFAQRPDWPRYFARRDELHHYLVDLADTYELRPSMLFGREVESMTWDGDRGGWAVTTRDADGAQETLTANVVISATGYLNRPAYPKIEGLDTFAGPCMHTARWRSDVDVAAKRVAVIGTGASAMQLVPAIAGIAERVVVFQRSPQWGLPNPNQPRSVSATTQLLMRDVPWYLGWYRLRLVWNFGDRLFPALQIDPDWPHPDRAVNAINDRHRQFLTKYITAELGERTDLLDKCVPTYPPYGKRPLLDAGWFRTVARHDVELVTDRIARVTPDGVVTETGDEIAADILVLATGFQNLNLLAPIEVRGRSGRTLRETWGEDDATAHLGITVPDFPNFFMLLGPNTIAGHGGSAALGIEMEVRYVMRMIARMVDEGITTVECRQEKHDAYVERLDAAMRRTIWVHPGMTTYYRNSRGRVVSTMPWTNAEFWHMTHEPDLDDFLVERAGSGAEH